MIYQNFVKTLNYKTMIMLELQTLDKNLETVSKLGFSSIFDYIFHALPLVSFRSVRPFI